MSNESVYLELEEWLRQSPRWQQDAAQRIMANGALSKDDIVELTALCLNEAAGKRPQYKSIPAGALCSHREDMSFSIVEISDVQGVNAIRQTAPLQLEPSGITVIYGKNGSGKSGYARILKKVSGAEDTLILPDIYEKGDVFPSCTIEVLCGGAREKVGCRLDGCDFDERLSALDIFDSSKENVYLKEGKQPAYLPEVFPFLLELISACGQIKASLDEKATARSVSFLPTIPEVVFESAYGPAIQGLSHETLLDAFDFEWTADEDEELASVDKYLHSDSPEAKTQLCTMKINSIELIMTGLNLMGGPYSKDRVERLNEALKRADVLAESYKGFLLLLDGDESVSLGAKEWLALWNAAAAFSNKVLYPGESFPSLEPESRCPLCLRPLGLSGVGNMAAMNEYVSSSIMKEIAALNAEVSEMLKAYPDPAAVRARLDIAHLEGIGDHALSVQIAEMSEKLVNESMYAKRKCTTRTYEAIDVLPLVSSLGILKSALFEERERLVSLCNPETMAATQRRYNELTAKKFLFENKSSLGNEIRRLKELHTLNEAIRLVRTNRLSSKINQLSEQLIAGNYANDFQEELNLTTEGRLHVDLQKQKAKKGRIPYVIKLSDVSGGELDPSDVLSEGEKRAVALAAFLADTRRQASRCPLVFDDPITSLDEDYESRILGRLLEVSKSRQVMVFTHRISTVVGIEEAASKIGCNCCTRQIATWPQGHYTGNPVGEALTKNPRTMLNGLERSLAELRRAESCADQAQCDLLSSYICTQMRIAVESCIEHVLIDGVVLRFRRSISTLNKLDKLSRITLDDCRLLDGMMTKYSFNEHLAPLDEPRIYRCAVELQNDRDRLLLWIQEFKHRS